MVHEISKAAWLRLKHSQRGDFVVATEFAMSARVGLHKERF